MIDFFEEKKKILAELNRAIITLKLHLNVDVPIVREWDYNEMNDVIDRLYVAVGEPMPFRIKSDEDVFEMIDVLRREIGRFET